MMSTEVLKTCRELE